MKAQYVLIMVVAFCIGSFAFGGSAVDWGYSGPRGPEHWGKLAPDFDVCSLGKNQSPIDLTAMIDADLEKISFAYEAGGYEITNDGHTIEVSYLPGSTTTVSGHTFELKQFHFHVPGENVIGGQSFPMEAHFVHADASGAKAVIAVLFGEGSPNAELQKAWDQMPDKKGEKHILKEKISADALMPASRDYYRYNGSLTTPPCSEGVWWFVMKNTITASKEQVEKLLHVLHHPNNRPVQPVNARIVAE